MVCDIAEVVQFGFLEIIEAFKFYAQISFLVLHSKVERERVLY